MLTLGIVFLKGCWLLMIGGRTTSGFLGKQQITTKNNNIPDGIEEAVAMRRNNIEQQGIAGDYPGRGKAGHRTP